jgi:hypothetical protein
MKNVLFRSALIISLVVFSLPCLGFNNPVPANDMKKGEQTGDEPGLVVLWTSADREVALKMVFMYTLNAKRNESRKA